MNNALLSNVYLVDDDASIRDAVTWLLSAANISLTCFPSAASFLKHVDPSQAGCVLLDICMPEMTGVELQEKLLNDNNVLNIVFLTGQADVPTTSKIFKNGAFDLLEKPVDAQALIAVVLHALEESYKKAQQLQERKKWQNCIAQLTHREKQILRLVLDGHQNKVIADRLHIALRTVEVHRHNLMQKMDNNSPVQLAYLLSKYVSDELNSL